jgi:hypothetical protein
MLRPARVTDSGPIVLQADTGSAHECVSTCGRHTKVDECVASRQQVNKCEHFSSILTFAVEEAVLPVLTGKTASFSLVYFL